MIKVKRLKKGNVAKRIEIKVHNDVNKSLELLRGHYTKSDGTTTWIPSDSVLFSMLIKDAANRLCD